MDSAYLQSLQDRVDALNAGVRELGSYRPRSLLLLDEGVTDPWPANATQSPVRQSSDSSFDSNLSHGRGAGSRAMTGPSSSANSSAAAGEAAFEAEMRKMGLISEVLWSKGGTEVLRHILQHANRCQHDLSVVEKVWSHARNISCAGYTQVASEFLCAFSSAADNGLLVRPLEAGISTTEGMTVFYPYAGMNLQEYFDGLRKSAPMDVFEKQLQRCLIHLLFGLEHVHTRGIVLRDLKDTNAIYDPILDIFRLSDTGLACRAGSITWGGDEGYPSADCLRRCHNGRARDYADTLKRVNQPALDVLALGELAYTAFTGQRPPAIDYDKMDNYLYDIKGVTCGQLCSMGAEELDKMLKEAYYNRCVAQVYEGGWDRDVDAHVAPYAPELANLLKLMLRPMDSRPNASQLLEHPYLQGGVDAENELIEKALPAWKRREAAAKQVATLVKHARSVAAMASLQQQVGNEGPFAGCFRAAASTNSSVTDATGTPCHNSSSSSNSSRLSAAADADSKSYGQQSQHRATSAKSGSSQHSGQLQTNQEQQHPANQHAPAAATGSLNTYSHSNASSLQRAAAACSEAVAQPQQSAATRACGLHDRADSLTDAFNDSPAVSAQLLELLPAGPDLHSSRSSMECPQPILAMSGSAAAAAAETEVQQQQASKLLLLPTIAQELAALAASVRRGSGSSNVATASRLLCSHNASSGSDPAAPAAHPLAFPFSSSSLSGPSLGGSGSGSSRSGGSSSSVKQAASLGACAASQTAAGSGLSSHFIHVQDTTAKSQPLAAEAAAAATAGTHLAGGAEGCRTQQQRMSLQDTAKSVSTAVYPARSTYKKDVSGGQAGLLAGSDADSCDAAAAADAIVQITVPTVKTAGKDSRQRHNRPSPNAAAVRNPGNARLITQLLKPWLRSL